MIHPGRSGHALCWVATTPANTAHRFVRRTLSLIRAQRETYIHLPTIKGVVDSLNRAFQHFTLVQNIQNFNPEDLPSKASTGNSFSNFARGFSARFHGGDNSVQSAKPSAEKLSYLRSSAEPSVPVSKLADTQTIQTWAALRSSFSAGSVLRRLSKEEREHAVLSSLSHSHHRKNQSQTSQRPTAQQQPNYTSQPRKSSFRQQQPRQQPKGPTRQNFLKSSKSQSFQQSSQRRQRFGRSSHSH